MFYARFPEMSREAAVFRDHACRGRKLRTPEQGSFARLRIAGTAVGRIHKVRLVDALERGILIGDGANGTSLSEKGFTRQPYDLANLLAPELVRDIHSKYFDAGSDFVETNTFSASRIRLEPFNVDVAELNFAGAALARQAAGQERLVLGAIGPIGKPMAPIGHITPEEVRAAVREQAEALAEGGVDGFVL